MDGPREKENPPGVLHEPRVVRPSVRVQLLCSMMQLARKREEGDAEKESERGGEGREM